MSACIDEGSLEQGGSTDNSPMAETVDDANEMKNGDAPPAGGASGTGGASSDDPSDGNASTPGGGGGIAGTQYTEEQLKNSLHINERKSPHFVELYFDASEGETLDLSNFAVATGGAEPEEEDMCSLSDITLSADVPYAVVQKDPDCSKFGVDGPCVGGCTFGFTKNFTVFLLAKVGDEMIQIDSKSGGVSLIGADSRQAIPDGATHTELRPWIVSTATIGAPNRY